MIPTRVPQTSFLNPILSVGLSLLLLMTFAIGCRDDASSLGPCEELLACCDKLPGANASTCHDSYDRFHDESGAETRCAEVLTGIRDLGMCQTSTDSAAGGGTEASNQTCADGLDNDADGFIDCNDYDCSRNEDVSVCSNVAMNEDSNQLCRDGIDNDSDGYIDCDDFDCSRNVSVSVCGSPGREDDDIACADGMDNDADGYIDCDDFDCLNAGVSVCSSCEKDFGDSGCVTCIELFCCDEGTQCFYNNEACFTFAECLLVCNGPSDACLFECTSIAPGGSQDHAALRQCVTTYCSAACT